MRLTDSVNPCPSSSPCPGARRPRSSPAATRSRIACPPSASARRSRHPPTLRACGAPAGYIHVEGRYLPSFSRPHPPPTRPRKATLGFAHRDFPRGGSEYVITADCGVSTVLEAIRVARKSWFLVPGELWEGRMPYSSRRATVASKPSQNNSVLSSVLSVALWFIGGRTA